MEGLNGISQSWALDNFKLLLLLPVQMNSALYHYGSHKEMLFWGLQNAQSNQTDAKGGLGTHRDLIRAILISTITKVLTVPPPLYPLPIQPPSSGIINRIILVCTAPILLEYLSLFAVKKVCPILVCSFLFSIPEAHSYWDADPDKDQYTCHISLAAVPP